jgi:DNA damage-inducible protein 1
MRLFQLASVKALIEEDLKIPVGEQHLLYNGTPLLDSTKSLKDYNIRQHDVIVVLRKPGAAPRSTNQQRGTPATNQRTNQPAAQTPFWEMNPETLRQQILNNPQLQQQTRIQNPELAEAAASNPERFKQLVTQIQGEMKRRYEAEREEATLMTADPFDIEAQKQIEERIRMQNVLQNMETAMEYNPEVFGTVHMLYVNVEVNGAPVKAFVDSGAQTTICIINKTELFSGARVCRKVRIDETFRS